MISNKKILVVIPARGGSKGIKLKNLLKIDGISLVGRACLFARNLDFVDRVIVSSDNSEILNEASKFSIDTPFMRPDHLSGDSVADIDVLEHALIETEKYYNETYDLILYLQPTSPLRKLSDVVNAINVMLEGGFDAVWSISKSDSKFHPLKQLKIIGDNLIYLYPSEGPKIIARQQLDEVYHRNGVVYIFSRNTILEKRSIYTDNCGYYICKDANISIDTMEDVEYINYLISRFRLNINGN